METTDLHALGALANTMRQRKVGNRASYIVNRYINYSNYCILSCQFCAFSKKKRDADGFQLTTEQIVEKARAEAKSEASFEDYEAEVPLTDAPYDLVIPIRQK